MSPLLDVRNLTTRFTTREGIVRAVNGVSFAVDAGEIVGMVGESGSGKSVSMLSMLRLIPVPPGEIADGEVHFYGRDLLKLNEHDMQTVRGTQIAMIFQDALTSLNPTLTVGYQIMEKLIVHDGMTKAQAQTRAIELLAMLGIPRAGDRLNDYPHQFSGGMRQRAMIAMALACNPMLLIADEPTTALDVTIQAQIVDLVKRLAGQMEMTIIWITHDLGVVARLVDRVMVMYAGFVVEQAGVDALFADPRHPYTIGLLESLPHLNSAPGRRLTAIPGQPPNLAQLPSGCPFAPRCRYAIDACREANPPLAAIDRDHAAACWRHAEMQGAWSGVRS